MATVEPLTVLLLTDPAGEAHAWPGHPERPERLPAVVEGVREGAATAGATLVEAGAPPASVEMAAAVHDASYVGWLAGTDKTGFLDADTYVVPASGRAALPPPGWPWRLPGAWRSARPPWRSRWPGPLATTRTAAGARGSAS
jgi:hypothetical protein